MAKTKDADTGQFAPFEPTPEERFLVAVLVGEGVTQANITRFIRRPNAKGVLERISLRTLERHFREELDEGRAVADAEIVQANYRLMRAGNPQVTMFMAKCRLGWKEVTEVHMRESYGDLVKQSTEKAEERRQAKLQLVQGDTKAA